jgi:hypothetical protein
MRTVVGFVPFPATTKPISASAHDRFWPDPVAPHLTWRRRFPADGCGEIDEGGPPVSSRPGASKGLTRAAPDVGSWPESVTDTFARDVR